MLCLESDLNRDYSFQSLGSDGDREVCPQALQVLWRWQILHSNDRLDSLSNILLGGTRHDQGARRDHEDRRSRLRNFDHDEVELCDTPRVES